MLQAESCLAFSSPKPRSWTENIAGWAGTVVGEGVTIGWLAFLLSVPVLRKSD
jgi:hypothetical protein